MIIGCFCYWFQPIQVGNNERWKKKLDNFAFEMEGQLKWLNKGKKVKLGEKWETEVKNSGFLVLMVVQLKRQWYNFEIQWQYFEPVEVQDMRKHMI